MKDKIIKLSIKNLQKDGLRFSVDTLARELKISKKTVYKYFASKEDLALAIYEKYYSEQEIQISRIFDSNMENGLFEALMIYSNSCYMVRDEIFNKYAINNTIKSYAISRHNNIWQKIEVMIPLQQREIAKIIIIGTFEKLCNSYISPEKVIEQLVKILC